MAREVKVAILGDAKSLIEALGLSNTSLGKFFADAEKKAALGGLAIGAGLAAGAVIAGKALFDLGEKFDDAFDKIRVGTGETGVALKGLEDDFKKVFASVPTDMGKAADAITVLHDKLGLTDEPLRKLARRFLEVSRITKTDLTANLTAGTDVLAQFGITGRDQVKALDLLFRAAQKSGLAFTDVESRVGSAGTVLRAAGFTFAESTALVATLGKAGIDVSDAMPALSKSLAVAAKDGKSAGQLLGETFYRIAHASNDIDAAAIGFEVFGAKAGPKFAQLIREGKLSYDDMLAGITGGKDTIARAAAQTSDFSESWTVFKNMLQVEIEPIATKVFTGIGRAMEWVVEHKKDFQTFFEDVGIAVQTAWTLVEPIYRALWEQLVAIFNLIDDLIHGRWGQIWSDLVGIVMAAVSFITAPVRGLADLLGIDLAGAAIWMGAVVENAFNAFIGAAIALQNAVSWPLNWIYDRLQDIASAAKYVADALPNVSMPGGPSLNEQIEGWGKRAAGGPVSAGMPYLVGEVGPELFVPGMSGSIVPNNALAGVGSGGGGVVVNVHGSILTERAVIDLVRDGLIQAGVRNGSALGQYA